MKIFGVFINLLLLTSLLHGQTLCPCKKASPTDMTREGGNVWMVMKEKGAFKFIGGKVTDAAGDALEGALVEVFDKPDYLLCESSPNNPNNCTFRPPATQHRKAACLTGKDGAFCFKDLPRGRYELRVSKDIQWNVMHSIVVVAPKRKDAKRADIEIIMSVGG